MSNDPQEALAIFAEGVCRLLEFEELVYADPAERALVAQLAIFLDGKFLGWSIGVDWNRFEAEVKRLRHQLPDEAFEREGAIVPDLIVHRVASVRIYWSSRSRNRSTATMTVIAGSSAG